MFQSEKSLATHQIETTASSTSHTDTKNNVHHRYKGASSANSSVGHKRYIKPLTTINGVTFVVIDRNILEQLDLNDTTNVTIEEEVTEDGILLKIVKSSTDLDILG